jgi:hypothetical protein
MPDDEKDTHIDQVDVDKGFKDSVKDGPIDASQLDDDTPVDEETQRPVSDGPVP